MIHIVDILGSARLFDPHNFYGQNALRRILMLNAPGLYWHIVGHKAPPELTISSYQYHASSTRWLDMIWENRGTQKRIPVICSFVVQSAETLITLLSDPDFSSRVRLCLLLHCTSHELFPHLFGGGQTPPIVADMIRLAVKAGAYFVCASEDIQRSYELPQIIQFLGADFKRRVRTISNTVDITWLLRDTEVKPLLMKGRECFVIGMMAGCKPYKGKDAVFEVLRLIERRILYDVNLAKWHFAFSALPNYGTEALLTFLNAECPTLIRNGHIHLFCDVSQWTDIAPSIAIDTLAAIKNFEKNICGDSLRLYRNLFRGVTSTPALREFSCQLRLSVHEGFGRAVIESIVVGVPVVCTRRDGMASLNNLVNSIDTPEDFSMRNSISGDDIHYFQACHEIAIKAVELMRKISEGELSSPHVDSLAGLAGTTAIQDTIHKYKNLFHELAHE